MNIEHNIPCVMFMCSFGGVPLSEASIFMRSFHVWWRSLIMSDDEQYALAGCLLLNTCFWAVMKR